jgi:hypothetical protein
LEIDGRVLQTLEKQALMALALSNSGWGGIRTHERLSPLPVFKTGAFNRSATHPEVAEAGGNDTAPPQAWT